MISPSLKLKIQNSIFIDVLVTNRTVIKFMKHQIKEYYEEERKNKKWKVLMQRNR